MVAPEDEPAPGLGAGSCAVAAPEPFGIEMEEDDKEDRQEEQDDRHKHDLVAKRNGVRVVEGLAQFGITHDFWVLYSLSLSLKIQMGVS